jgi:4-hydroxybenzoate polyprenyltransferase
VLVIAFLTVPVFWVLFVARQVLSWRRATGERRAQLKWLMAGSIATVIGLAGTVLLQSLTLLDDICLAVGIFSLPVCIIFAILKYRLYDIDRLISRTLSYTVVTGLLVGLYAGLVLFATHVLGFRAPVAVAASTLVAAALFNPLRHWVQRLVDRRFNRARYDADKTVAAFASRLRDEVDLDSIRDDLATVVYKALEPAQVSVWISQVGRDFGPFPGSP